MPRAYSKFRARCNRCGQVRTLASLERGHCKPCGYSYDNCVRCLAFRKIYVSGRCYLCYQDDLVRARLAQIEAAFIAPASEYNRLLFELYLTYLRRHRMSYDHEKPTQRLADFLSRESVPRVRRWNDIYRLSERVPLTRSPGRPVHDNGCAWSKIGLMLQEMGVLGPRCDEHQHRIEKILEDVDSATAELLRGFARRIKNSGRTDSTITRWLTVLCCLTRWLYELDPPETLLLASQASIECYLEFMFKNCSYSYTVSNLRRIRGFYRWAKREKILLHDPASGSRLSRPAQKISICSKIQFDQLSDFLRDQDANVEQALAIILILFFGLTTEDLAQASLDPGNDPSAGLKIVLTRKPRSRGRRYYNREQLLVLPAEPLWLKKLTLRFHAHWQDALQKIRPKTSFPRTPLFLDPQGLHNRNLGDDYIRTLVSSATLTATGTSIPPRILRHTCGHIMVRGNDASALSYLGWSPQTALQYTWLPRIRFQSKV